MLFRILDFLSPYAQEEYYAVETNNGDFIIYGDKTDFSKYKMENVYLDYLCPIDYEYKSQNVIVNNVARFRTHYIFGLSVHTHPIAQYISLNFDISEYDIPGCELPKDISCFMVYSDEKNIKLDKLDNIDIIAFTNKYYSKETILVNTFKQLKNYLKKLSQY